MITANLGGFFDSAAQSAGASAAAGAAPVIQQQLNASLAQAEAQVARIMLFTVMGIAVIALGVLYVVKE